MNEYMLYIQNDGSQLPADKEQEFLKQCELYIEELKKQGKLISAQPLGEESRLIYKLNGTWVEQPGDAPKNINSGYYHIRAKDLDEAVALAKQNPEFIFRPSAKIEVHSVKTEEESTSYVYPTEN